MNKSIFYYHYVSPLGVLTLEASETALLGLHFGDVVPKNAIQKETLLLTDCMHQLEEYFDKKRTAFTLPLEPRGTVFQQKVWQALTTIPYGETRSYKQIAEMIDNPKACRAVGMANNRNPISLIIPCHRVIGANGSLVGYGGGLAIKEKLLVLEGFLLG
ncbi:methylated-DNA--[protein]-cysteine S-methyltransferase [Scatolibacter rhodanostii]|uniref:methylated-DNA--[protein]-cysteine S-methyltransferase n=1 Tax=Scatolibacter rhodanostii TaxID=2014781 RepID=UPI000C07299E|nr:methylated-DNA--[protein]-cysteine S-methyltransferase [Scatolibacter rhodanostii]